MKMLNHKNNFKDDLNKEREVTLNLAQQKHLLDIFVDPCQTLWFRAV